MPLEPQARRFRFSLLALGSVLALGTLPTVALAGSGDRIGDTVLVMNSVTADLAKESRKLAVGDDVRQDELIEVSADSRGEFKLDDDTKLALAAGARLKLDKFVYDSDKNTGSIVVNMTKGAFRFITGVAKKRAYVVKTPNASITVRGTIFDVFILSDLSTWVLLHEGAVEVTGSKNGCRVLSEPGKLIRIGDDGKVGRPENWEKLQATTKVDFDTAFPFVANAPQIDPTPVLTRAAILSNAAADQPDEKCLNPAPTEKVKKVRRASRGDDDATPPPTRSKKRAAEKADSPAPKRIKTATKRPRRPADDDDWGEGAVRGMDIVIGIGIGSGIGKKHHRRPSGGDGPRYPNRTMPR